MFPRFCETLVLLLAASPLIDWFCSARLTDRVRDVDGNWLAAHVRPVNRIRIPVALRI